MEDHNWECSSIVAWPCWHVDVIDCCLMLTKTDVIPACVPRALRCYIADLTHLNHVPTFVVMATLDSPNFCISGYSLLSKRHISTQSVLCPMPLTPGFIISFHCMFYKMLPICFRCVEDTQSDYVEFSNFNIKLKDRKMARLCGTKEEHQKKEVKSDGNFFRVTFKSNDVYDATGFQAFYQFRKYEGKPLWFREQKTISCSCMPLFKLCILPETLLIFQISLELSHKQFIYHCLKYFVWNILNEIYRP